MRLRFGVTWTMVLSLATGACASSGGGGGGGGEEMEGPPITVQGEVIPVGIAPRQNEHTEAAGELLDQADATEDPAAAEDLYAQALARAQAGIQADSVNPLSYFQAGLAYAGMNDLAGADSMFARAQELHPRYVVQLDPLRFNLWVNEYRTALDEMNAGNDAAAIELLANAHEIYRGRPEAALLLGQLKAGQGELEEAAVYYQEAVDIINSDAIEAIDSATEVTWRENEVIATQNLAQIYSQTGQHERAAAIYRQMLEDDPNDVLALTNLAVTMVQLEQADSARALYDALLGRPDLTDRELFNAGVGLYQIEEYDRAADAFARVLEESPRHRDALQNLIQTLGLLERNEDIVPYAERLMEMDPRNEIGYRILARALLNIGEEDRAQEIYAEGEAWAFTVDHLQFQARGTGGGVLVGDVINRSLEPGTAVRLRFTFYGDGGGTLAQETVEITAPEQETSQTFRLPVEVDQRVRGYSYEVLAP